MHGPTLWYIEDHCQVSWEKILNLPFFLPSFPASAVLASPLLWRFQGCYPVVFQVLPCRPTFALQISLHPSLCCIARSLSTFFSFLAAHRLQREAQLCSPTYYTFKASLPSKFSKLHASNCWWRYLPESTSASIPTVLHHIINFPFTAFHTYSHSSSAMAIGILARLTVYQAPDV